jgi:hypothetical protein
MTAIQQEQIVQAQAGDRAAFEALFEAYRRPIFKLLLGLLHSPEDAADACQETFLRAWVYLARLRDPAAFPIWLQRIAIRVCRDRSPAIPVSPLPEEGSEVSDPLQPGTYKVALSYRTWSNGFRCRFREFKGWAPVSEAWLGWQTGAEIRPGKMEKLPPLRLVRSVEMKYPLYRDVVSTHVPTFAWEPFPGAVRYRVTLLGPTSSGFRSFWVSQPVAATHLTYAPERGQVRKPGDVAYLSLQPGQEYRWSVDALDPDGNLISYGRFGYFRMQR